MSRIEKEKETLLKLAGEHGLAGYPEHSDPGTHFVFRSGSKEQEKSLQVYSSGENHELEAAMKKLWRDEDTMQKCIPIILACVAKSRETGEHKVITEELYNYTM